MCASFTTSPGAKVPSSIHSRRRQIVPPRLFELLRDPDRQKAKRVTEAMLQMRKLDIGGLERAAAQD